MILYTQKSITQQEKVLYDTVLSFLKKIRKAGKTSAQEWSDYRATIGNIAPNAALGKAADIWTIDNIDLFAPNHTQLPQLNDMEFVAQISPKFYSQLIEALYYGMLNPMQANMISDELQDADPDCVSIASLEELMVKLWISNAKTYKTATVN